MPKDKQTKNQLGKSARASMAHSSPDEVTSDFATFELDVEAGKWNWGEQAIMLFGLDPKLHQSMADWQRSVFIDDLPKILDAVQASTQGNMFYVEFRVTHSDGSLHWLAGK